MQKYGFDKKVIWSFWKIDIRINFFLLSLCVFVKVLYLIDFHYFHYFHLILVFVFWKSPKIFNPNI